MKKYKEYLDDMMTTGSTGIAGTDYPAGTISGYDRKTGKMAHLSRPFEKKKKKNKKTSVFPHIIQSRKIPEIYGQKTNMDGIKRSGKYFYTPRV